MTPKQAYYQRKRDTGECYDCKQPALPDRRRCQKHQERALAANERHVAPTRIRETLKRLGTEYDSYEERVAVAIQEAVGLGMSYVEIASLCQRDQRYVSDRSGRPKSNRGPKASGRNRV